jgi:hypothetical protein
MSTNVLIQALNFIIYIGIIIIPINREITHKFKH